MFERIERKIKIGDKMVPVVITVTEIAVQASCDEISPKLRDSIRKADGTTITNIGSDVSVTIQESRGMGYDEQIERFFNPGLKSDEAG